MRIADKHFFNPSNFALITALALFYNDAHIVLGQLGSEVWLALTVMAMAIAILVRVERWIVPIVFIATYLSFQYIFVVHHDPVLTMDDIYQRFYSVSFIVFVLFMLTDPATTPQSAKGQIGFVLIVSSLAVWMDRENGFRVQHLFMALFLISVFVPIAIQWQNKKKIRYLAVGTLFVLLLALSAIIYIEIQPPYYFEMDG
jgi:Na+-translocating ferredoxin:NAD+ oxidoreductase RnfD subunit